MKPKTPYSEQMFVRRLERMVDDPEWPDRTRAVVKIGEVRRLIAKKLREDREGR